MSDSVYYHQGCPVCGRMLRIGVRLLGHRVYCQHCGGGFRATDSELESAGDTAVRGSQTDRVEQLLARAAETLARGAEMTAAGCFAERMGGYDPAPEGLSCILTDNDEAAFD